MIPLCDLQLPYLAHKDEIDDAMQQVAAQARYILGPNVKAFEQEMAEYMGCRYAVGVGSGTDALHLALRALGIGLGDEVITTPFTFIATTEAIGIVGATPVFVDIDPRTYNMDPRQVEQAITPSTKAILPIHLYGQPCDMSPIVDIAERHGLQIVEDCAQSIGAEYQGKRAGTFGKAGCLSFFPSKNLGCFGDGGMLVTDDLRVYERAEMLRRHGGKVKYHHTELGLNSRLDELQAAVLRVKLRHLDAANARRQAAACHYNRRLADLADVSLPSELTEQGLVLPMDASPRPNTHLKAVYHQYTILVERRNEVSRRLLERGVQSTAYYPVPLHLQAVHAPLRYRAGDFPNAERVADRCLSLPMFPEISDQQLDKAAHSLRESLAANRYSAA